MELSPERHGNQEEPDRPGDLEWETCHLKRFLIFYTLSFII